MSFSQKLKNILKFFSRKLVPAKINSLEVIASLTMNRGMSEIYTITLKTY